MMSASLLAGWIPMIERKTNFDQQVTIHFIRKNVSLSMHSILSKIKPLTNNGSLSTKRDGMALPHIDNSIKHLISDTAVGGSTALVWIRLKKGKGVLLVQLLSTKAFQQTS